MQVLLNLIPINQVSTSNMNEDDLSPNPAALVESLRAFPYSAHSAIADLIDNSITAESRIIQINARWDNANPSVEIVDNGKGMNNEMLREALRFAGTGPSTLRNSGDLGRFGLGLKTASLSQCRRMTVTSVRDGNLSNLGWDVDELRNAGGRWNTVNSDKEIIENQMRLLNGGEGTIVRWQKLDRLLGLDVENHSSDDLDMIFETVAIHLEVVFHRFLSRVNIDGKPELTIYVNDRQLQPWDPFLCNYPIDNQVWKIEEQDIELPSGVSRVVGYVLPTEREATADDCHQMWEFAGRGRWNQLQGFYVYRLDRLITHGSYLGLSRLQDEHTKLARIEVELNNETDDDWLLDVTKSMVSPPVRAQGQLKQIARTVCSKASSRYRSRVRSFCKTCNQRPCVCPRSPKFEFVWRHPNTFEETGKFAINTQHSTIKQFRIDLNDDQVREFDRIIRLISKTIPVAHIRGIPSDQERDFVERFDDSKSSLGLLRELLNFAVAGRLLSGELPESIRKSLLWTEPFSDFPDLIDETIARHANLPITEMGGDSWAAN